jgi:hypothetical protein
MANHHKNDEKAAAAAAGDQARGSGTKSITGDASQPSAGPIVHRSAEDIAHDKAVLGDSPQAPGESQSQKAQGGRSAAADASLSSRQKQGGQESQGDRSYSIEVPGLPAIGGSSLQDFTPTELNQPLEDFVVVTSADATIEEWWRTTELYKDEPTASSYKKDITLKTLDSNGKEIDSHIIKEVYPKRRVERTNGAIEWTLTGSFIATSSTTRQHDGEPQARSRNVSDEIGTRPTSPSKPSPKSEG